MGGTLQAVGNAIAAPIEGAAKTVGGIFTGNPGEIGQGLAGLSPLSWVPGNVQNYAQTGQWGPRPGQPGPQTFQPPSFSGTQTVPTAAPAPTTPVSPTSTGAATPVNQLSAGQRAAISSGAIGQLPGLIKSDVGSGMGGLTPEFLANQAAWASGFTNQTPYIQTLVQQYLQQNPNALGGPGL